MPSNWRNPREALEMTAVESTTADGVHGKYFHYEKQPDKKNPGEFKEVLFIHWDLFDAEIKKAVQFFKQKNISPSLRTYYYRFESLGYLPSGLRSYKNLGERCVKLRKDRVIPWDSFTDGGRHVLGDFVDEYWSTQEYTSMLIGDLKNGSKNYMRDCVPRWLKQPNYTEAWIEKTALEGTFERFLEDRDVRIVPNRGYAGWSFLYNNCQELKRVLNTKDYVKHIYILYFGDFNPSGDDMDRFLNEALRYFGLAKSVTFRRVAVTPEQIRRYNLPPLPSNQKGLDKLNNDSRKAGFIRKYGKLYGVELDALLALVPDEFEKLVQQSVDQLFDQRLYKRIQAKLSVTAPREVGGHVRRKVRFLE